jgi:hypothetical protein
MSAAFQAGHAGSIPSPAQRLLHSSLVEPEVHLRYSGPTLPRGVESVLEVDVKLQHVGLGERQDL